MIVISGQARLLEPEVRRAVQAASAMASTSRNEPGCIDYRFAIDIDDPLVAQSDVFGADDEASRELTERVIGLDGQAQVPRAGAFVAFAHELGFVASWVRAQPDLLVHLPEEKLCRDGDQLGSLTASQAASGGLGE